MAATAKVFCGVPGCIKLHVPVHFKRILKDNLLLLKQLFPLLFRNDTEEVTGKEREQEEEAQDLLWFLEMYNEVFPESGPGGFIGAPDDDGGDMTMGKFREVYRKRFNGMLCLSTSSLKEVQLLALAEAKKSAENAAAAAGATDLEGRIEREQMWIEKINDFKKEVVVCSIQTKTLEAFCEKAREAFSLDPRIESDFYSQEEQRQRESYSAERMEVAIKNLLEKEISLQDVESELAFTAKVRSKLLGIEDQFVGTSCRSNMRAGELKMVSIVDELKESYKKKISGVLVVSPLMKTSSIRNILQEARADCVNEFEKREKPDDPEFQKGYLKMLYRQMLEVCKEVLGSAHLASLAQIEAIEQESRQGVESCLGKTSLACSKACVPEYAERMHRTVEMELEEVISDLGQNTLANKAVVQLILDMERKACETGSRESKPCGLDHLPMSHADCKEILSLDPPEEQVNLNEGQQHVYIEHLLETVADAKIREEINTFVGSYVKQYIDKMRDLRKRNPNGLEAEELTKCHLRIKSEMKTLLERDIRAKTDDDELIAVHWKSFLTYTDPYWEIVWEENNTKTKKIEEIQNRPQEQMVQQKAIESKPSIVKDHQRTMSTLPNSGKSKALPPIVFQFRPSRVVMGMMVDGNPQLIQNQWGEDYTIPVIGLRTGNQQRHAACDSDDYQHLRQDNKPSWIYGSAVLSLQDADEHQTLLKTWRIADCIIRNDTPWKEDIDVGGQKLQITFELLLGYLLSQLKRFAELKMGVGSFSTAVITVPFWLTSSQRIQVKDAGRVAGFTDVYLVNESSAAVFACVANCAGRPSSEPILVLAETSGIVEAFVYSYDEETKKKKTIKMKSHAGKFKEGPKFELCNKIVSPEESQERIANGVRQVCKKACLEFQNIKTLPLPRELLVLSESPHWTQLLEAVGKEFATRKAQVGTMSEIVLNGAILLSQNPQEIGERIVDMLAFPIIRAVDMPRSVVSVFSNRTSLPINSSKVSQHLPRYHAGARFYQVVRGVVIPIGNLFIPTEVKKNRSVNIELQITNEGIVTLKCITLDSFNARAALIPNLIGETRYTWKTPNLTDDSLTGYYASLISMSESIGQRKQAEAEQNTLLETEKRRETLME